MSLLVQNEEAKREVEQAISEKLAKIGPRIIKEVSPDACVVAEKRLKTENKGRKMTTHFPSVV